MCVLGNVSEEGLSGKRDDVCSSAAELGHRKMEKERKRVRGRDDRRGRSKEQWQDSSSGEWPPRPAQAPTHLTSTFLHALNLRA